MTQQEQTEETSAAFHVSGQGSIAILKPLSDHAVEWLNEHVDLDFNGEAVLNSPIYMEPRYVQVLLDGYYSGEDY